MVAVVFGHSTMVCITDLCQWLGDADILRCSHPRQRLVTSQPVSQWFSLAAGWPFIQVVVSKDRSKVIGLGGVRAPL